jgi:tetratricopeptide (TPR) repeat protein
MYEKAGQARKAAEIYYAAGKLKESADALEKAGDLVGAGQLAIRMEDHSRAAHLLAQVPQNDPRFVQATGLLSEVLVKLNRRDLATQRLAAAVPPGSIVSDKMTAELAYRLGRLMWEAGQNDQARRAFELVNAWDPKYKDVTAALASLKGGATIAEEETDPFRPTSATGPMRPLPKREIPPPKVTDPFAALDGNPFAPKAGSITAATTLPRGAPPRAAETVRIAYTQRMEGYDALKALPIFEDLSLDEMKAFYNICESAFYRGNVRRDQDRARRQGDAACDDRTRQVRGRHVADRRRPDFGARACAGQRQSAVDQEGSLRTVPLRQRSDRGARLSNLRQDAERAAPPTKRESLRLP